MTGRLIVIGAATAAVLLARIGLVWFAGVGGHLAEPYSQHPWLLAVDLATPFVYFFAVLVAVTAVQKAMRGPRVSSLLVALCTWALTCSLLVALTNERMARSLRQRANQYIWQAHSEEALAYVDRVQVYLLAGFAGFAALGAFVGVAVGDRRLGS